MIKAKSRIKELTSTTGTGSLALTGAETGFQAFSVLGNATRCYYTVTDVNETSWECGEGVYNSNSLTREVVLESSNGGTAISLSATGSTVFLSYPSDFAAYSNVGVNREYVASGNIAQAKPLILNVDGTVTQVTSGTLNKTNYIGIANSSASSGESVPVNQVGSYNNLQSALTVGSDYYCSDSGDIVLRTDSGGSVLATQFLGTARSSTDLQLLSPPSEFIGFSDGIITKGKAVQVSASNGHVEQVIGSGSSGSEIRPLTPYTINSSTTYTSPFSICSTSDGAGTTAVMWLDSSEYPNVSIGTTDSVGAQTWRAPYQPMSAAVKSQSCGIAWSSNFNTDVSAYEGAFVISFLVGSSSGQFHNYALQFTASNNLSLKGEASRGPNANYGASTELISNSFDEGLGRVNVLLFKPYGMMFSVLTRTFTTGLVVGEETFPLGGSYTGDMQFGNQVYDNTNNRGIIAYRDEGNGDLPTAVAYSTSTAYPYYTYGTPKVLDTSTCLYINVAEGEADGNGTVIAWNNGGTSAYKYTTLSFSGLTITNTSPSTFESSAVIDSFQNLIYNKEAQVYSAVYEDGNSNAYLRDGVYSSGSVTWSSAKLLQNTRAWNSLFISPSSGNGAMSIVSGHTTTNSYPTGISYQPAFNNSSSNLSEKKYLGIALETVADNTDVKINAYGVDPTQSGLTINEPYYVDSTTGGASLTPSTPSVKIGKAISTTDILID